jgi:hypothetical protein
VGWSYSTVPTGNAAIVAANAVTVKKALMNFMFVVLAGWLLFQKKIGNSIIVGE